MTAGLQGIDRRLKSVASLGASPLVILRKVTLPSAMLGVVSGAVFAFAASLDEVVLAFLVAGPNHRTVAR